jgi:hypothetical protein
MARNRNRNRRTFDWHGSEDENSVQGNQTNVVVLEDFDKGDAGQTLTRIRGHLTIALEAGAAARSSFFAGIYFTTLTSVGLSGYNPQNELDYDNWLWTASGLLIPDQDPMHFEIDSKAKRIVDNESALVFSILNTASQETPEMDYTFELRHLYQT